MSCLTLSCKITRKLGEVKLSSKNEINLQREARLGFFGNSSRTSIKFFGFAARSKVYFDFF